MNDRPVSAFSRSFALHLRGVMAERNIQQADVAKAMGRSKGYVSEHTSGRRAVDSDLLDAVAEAAGIDTRDLIAEIARRMSTAPASRENVEETAGRIVAQARADARAADAETGEERRTLRPAKPARGSA